MSDLCTIAFQSEAFEFAARQMLELKGLTVRVVPREAESFDAELVYVNVGQDGQFKARFAVWNEERDEADHSQIKVLDIYDELERIEVL